MRNADIVGLPSPEWFAPANTAADISGTLGYAGTALAGQAMIGEKSPDDIVPTTVFQDLARRGLFFGELLRGRDCVGLVGPWDLSGQLASTFSIW